MIICRPSISVETNNAETSTQYMGNKLRNCGIRKLLNNNDDNNNNDNNCNTSNDCNNN